MHAAVMAQVGQADAVVMAAAVADYAPRDGVRGEKIKKAEGDLTLTLQRTPDILAELGGRRSDAPRPVLVGFAAETGDLVERARHKLQSKGSRPDRGERCLEAGAGLCG